MKIVVCQLPGSLPEAAPGLVLFEIGVEGEDHWLLRDNVETICGWLLGKPAVASVPGLDDADRIVIQKIYVEMAPLNNVVINVSARLDDIERMVNGLVDILERNSGHPIRFVAHASRMDADEGNRRETTPMSDRLTNTETLKPGDLFCYKSLPVTTALLVKTEWPKRTGAAGLENLGGVLLAAENVGGRTTARANYLAGEEFDLPETVIHLGSIEWDEGPELTASEIGPGTIFVYNGKLFVCAVLTSLIGAGGVRPGGGKERAVQVAYYEFESGLADASLRLTMPSARAAHPSLKFQTLRVRHDRLPMVIEPIAERHDATPSSGPWDYDTYAEPLPPWENAWSKSYVGRAERASAWLEEETFELVDGMEAPPRQFPPADDPPEKDQKREPGET
jgi:hypothetical protein